MKHGDPRIHSLVRHFRQLHGAMPRLYRAPGRVNLIGEHTDYNDGWVMPIALQFETRVAIAPRRDRRLSLRSLNVEGGIELELPQDFSSTPPPPRTGRWFDYPVGVVWALGRAGLPSTGAAGGGWNGRMCSRALRASPSPLKPQAVPLRSPLGGYWVRS